MGLPDVIPFPSWGGDWQFGVAMSDDVMAAS